MEKIIYGFLATWFFIVSFLQLFSAPDSLWQEFWMLAVVSLVTLIGSIGYFCSINSNLKKCKNFTWTWFTVWILYILFAIRLERTSDALFPWFFYAYMGVIALMQYSIIACELQELPGRNTIHQLYKLIKGNAYRLSILPFHRLLGYGFIIFCGFVLLFNPEVHLHPEIPTLRLEALLLTVFLAYLFGATYHETADNTIDWKKLGFASRLNAFSKNTFFNFFFGLAVSCLLCMLIAGVGFQKLFANLSQLQVTVMLPLAILCLFVLISRTYFFIKATIIEILEFGEFMSHQKRTSI